MDYAIKVNGYGTRHLISSPESSISRTSWTIRLFEMTDFAIVNGVVRPERTTDQEFWIDDVRVRLMKIFCPDWVHVMNDQSSEDLVSFDSQIASQISCYDFEARLPPKRRRIELLVQPPLMTKRRHAYLCMDTQILVPLFEVVDLTELAITSSRHR
jgi:hypothetical protein